MRNGESLVKKLVDLGISEKEAMIYSALLQKRELSAIEIQRISHIPRTKVYEITHKMVLNNMCIEKHVHGKTRYQAVEPMKFLHNLIQRHEQELIDKRKLAMDIGTLAAPLYNRGRQNSDPSKSAEIIRDYASIHERYINLLKGTKTEILGLVKPPYVHRHNESMLEEQDDLLFQKIKQGLDVRTLYEIPKTKIKWTFNYIKKCVEQGEKARIINSVPAKMYIFDGRHIIVALTDEERPASPLTMYTIEHPALAQAGKMLFNHLWEQAQDYRILESRIRQEQ